MVTGSADMMLRLWDLKDGTVLKEMKGHHKSLGAVAVSRNGQLIASGDTDGKLITWHGETGECLTQAIQAHSVSINSLDFSPDGVLIATGSRTTKQWSRSTGTWGLKESPIDFHKVVHCVRYSPSGEFLAIATSGDIQVLNTCTRECIATFVNTVTNNPAWTYRLAWTPDATRLLSGGNIFDPTIRERDTSTWKEVSHPWTGHTAYINAIAVNSDATLVASASNDSHVRLWRLLDRRTIALFKHSGAVNCVTFSFDGMHILSGGEDRKISEWTVPEDALRHNASKDQVPDDTPPDDGAEEQKRKLVQDSGPEALDSDNITQPSFSRIIFISMTLRNVCINGDLTTAEALLTQEINADGNNYNSYANRSFVMSRKFNWDRALLDALKSVSIQPSLTGFISKGIALCGKRHFEDAMKAFDVASVFTKDSTTVHLLLIKAIALFNANQHEDAILRIQDLAVACRKVDSVTCHLVEAYLRVQMGNNALNVALYDKAAGYFTAAVDNIALSPKLNIYSTYEDFVVLFGLDFRSLWQIANQKRCHSLFHAGRLQEAVTSCQYMMDMSDETTKASCLDWYTDFKTKCGAVYAADADANLAASDYTGAIKLYSTVIDLGSGTDTVYANRSRAKSQAMLWEEALLDAQKVIELNPVSYVGYQLKYSALHGAQRYDEAINTFRIMLSKMGSAPEPLIRELRQRYLSPSEVAITISKVIRAQLSNAPLRLLHTFTGRLCGRDAQKKAFETSMEYNRLLSSILEHADLPTGGMPNVVLEHMQNVVLTYFRCVMLSHRWEEKEPLLHDIQGKVVDELNPVGGIAKLQSFCKTVRDAGYCWGWIDTCCIDQKNQVELQTSLNSMYEWYHHSALTIVYLSDVPPLSSSGALANSAWITRGWTVPEFLAPKVVRFYQKDWTLYLDDHSFNHKKSAIIMRELEDATGIDASALVAFSPVTRRAREKLQWASNRDTTVQEDIAYSLFGIFGVQLPVMYGERKEKALGRLLQEIVAQSGDITALDWVGKSSQFNSCLPADITPYNAPPYRMPVLSADEMQTLLSSLERARVLKLALKLYNKLDSLSDARFAHRRLHLHCVVFPVTEVRRRPPQDQQTHPSYDVKANGLRDLVISTEERLIQSSRTTRKFLLVRPWDRCLLKLPGSADDIESEEDVTAPGSPGDDGMVDLGSHSRTPRLIRRVGAFFNSLNRFPGTGGPVDVDSHLALLLIIRLGQPFRALLLLQCGGGYKRIASDCAIIAQVKDATSVRNMMDVRTLEIL